MLRGTLSAAIALPILFGAARPAADPQAGGIWAHPLPVAARELIVTPPPAQVPARRRTVEGIIAELLR